MRIVLQAIFEVPRKYWPGSLPTMACRRGENMVPGVRQPFVLRDSPVVPW